MAEDSSINHTYAPARVNIFESAGRSVALVAALFALLGSALGSYGSYILLGARVEGAEKRLDTIQADTAIRVANWDSWREEQTKMTAAVNAKLDILIAAGGR